MAAIFRGGHLIREWQASEGTMKTQGKSKPPSAKG
jgi:hypothetical protein